MELSKGDLKAIAGDRTFRRYRRRLYASAITMLVLLIVVTLVGNEWAVLALVIVFLAWIGTFALYYGRENKKQFLALDKCQTFTRA